MVSTLAVWQFGMGLGEMDGKHQFEAEAIAAVSQAGYFSLQSFPIGHYSDRP